MSDRATGILNMLAAQFVGEEPDGRLNDGIMYNVIMSAIQEVKDINNVVDAFHHAERIKEIANVKQEKQNQQGIKKPTKHHI
ncbi:MAG: hypothetical protein WCP96_19110 [Methylococcaceae bacterium]